MPLRGYMKTTDPGRISSITNVEDKSRRKRIVPLPVKTKEMYIRMYVADCETHDPPGTVAPVELFAHRDGVGWVSLGIAKCCPLCWLIIQPPPDTDLPPPRPVEYGDPNSAFAQGRRKKPSRKDKKLREDPYSKYFEVVSILRKAGTLTTAEVMSTLGLRRTAARRYLEQAVERKVAVKTVGAGGPAGKTVYSLKKNPT